MGNWQSKLCKAISQGNIDKVTKLVTKSNIRKKLSKTQKYSSSSSPIHLAVLENKEEILDVILSHGGQANSVRIDDDLEVAPMHLVVIMKRWNLIKVLVKFGADLEVMAKIGE